MHKSSGFPLQECRHISQRRVVEQVADVELARESLIDSEDYFGQGQRTYTDFEQVVICANLSVFRNFTTNCHKFGHDRVLFEGIVRFRHRRRQLFHNRVELPFDTGLQQLRALHLAARRLGNAGNRNDLVDLETGVFADDFPDPVCQRPECIDVLPEEYENDQLFSLPAFGCRARDHDLVQVQTVELGDDLLDVVRIVVLPVDYDDVFLAPRDDEVLIDEYPAVARTQPAIGSEQLCGCLLSAVDSFGDAATFEPRRSAGCGGP